eukprot:403339091
METLLKQALNLPANLLSINSMVNTGIQENITSAARMLSWEDITVVQDEKVNYTQCIFPGTQKIYLDCCTDSSSKVCTYISVMFFVVFVAYVGLFGYILHKNPWIKRHGLYINVFFFQMNVIILRGLFYSWFGRQNESLNSYIAFRTAPLVDSLISMSSYTIHLLILIHRYGTDGTMQQKRKYQIKMHFVFWGVFICLVALWILVWRLSVTAELLTVMDSLLSVCYAFFLVVQVQLVRKLYSNLKIKMPPVAKAAECHIFLMKLILILHISLRIVMNSMSDSSSKEQATFAQQMSWIYILFGDSITELLSAFGMILLVTLTFKFDSMALQYNQQSEQYAAMNPDNDSQEELVPVKHRNTPGGPTPGNPASNTNNKNYDNDQQTRGGNQGVRKQQQQNTNQNNRKKKRNNDFDDEDY